MGLCTVSCVCLRVCVPYFMFSEGPFQVVSYQIRPIVSDDRSSVFPTKLKFYTDPRPVRYMSTYFHVYTITENGMTFFFQFATVELEPWQP